MTHTSTNTILHDIYVLLLCYNEESIILQTIQYYTRIFPTATILVYDNHSTDGSREIAVQAGAHVTLFGHADRKDNTMNIQVKNAAWKALPSPCWVFCLDMDEWVKITVAQLYEEQCKHTSVIRTVGYQMVADVDVDDLSLRDITHGLHDHMMSKPVAFHLPNINTIGYALGAHTCNPEGDVQYSDSAYPLYHFKYIGLRHLTKNHITNHRRTDIQRKENPRSSTHYTSDESLIALRYACVRKMCVSMPSIDNHDDTRNTYPEPVFPKQTASTKSGLAKIVEYVQSM